MLYRVSPVGTLLSKKSGPLLLSILWFYSPKRRDNRGVFLRVTDKAHRRRVNTKMGVSNRCFCCDIGVWGFEHERRERGKKGGRGGGNEEMVDGCGFGGFAVLAASRSLASVSTNTKSKFKHS